MVGLVLPDPLKDTLKIKDNNKRHRQLTE